MIAGVLLAAGGSRRMGSPKALARAGRDRFITRGVLNLWTACDHVITVLGAEAAAIRKEAEAELVRRLGDEQLARELARAPGRDRGALELAFVTNTAWRRGMLSSARLGIAEALRGRPGAVLVLPVDHPNVRGATLAALSGVMGEAIAAFKSPRERARFRYALVPRHRGRRGHPVALSFGLAKAVAADRDAADLSDAIRRNARMVGYLDVTDAGIVRNRNTPRD